MFSSLGVITLFNVLNYSHTNQIAKKEVAQKKRDLTEIQSDYKRIKEQNESGKNKNQQLKKESTEIKKSQGTIDKEINNAVETYLIKSNNLNDLREMMIRNLSSMPLPKGKVLIQENGQYKVVNKADDPTYKWAQGIVYKVDGGDVEDVYQRLKTSGLPFADNGWPSRVSGFAIGTKEYDHAMDTNFSGTNPHGAFASAKDSEAQAYLKRLEEEKKKAEAKRKEEEEKKKKEEEKKKEKAKITPSTSSRIRR